jgi:acetyl esterase/lipase
MSFRVLPWLMQLLLVATVAGMSPGIARAQALSAPSAAVAQVRAGVAALGKRWNAEVNAQTARLYEDIQRPHPPSGIREVRNASYGPDRRQRLDLYYPDQGFDDLGPVFVFLQGDVEADHDRVAVQLAAVLYANAARSLARFGGVGIRANYRQLPNAKWPAGADDIRALLAWARQHVAKYGGDPASIIVLGTGEGAMYLATYLFHQPSQLKDGPGIAGAILGSGTFDPASDPAIGRYFGSRNAAYWPLNLVDSYQGHAVPILMWSAEYDPVESGVAEMKDKLCQKYGTCPMFAQLAGHNHVSPVMSIDSMDVSAAAWIVRFYHTAVRK